jgi:hypothetical protein
MLGVASAGGAGKERGHLKQITTQIQGYCKSLILLEKIF